MKRSRRKLILGKGVKTEGEEAKNIIVSSGSSSSKPSNTKKPSSIFLSPSTGREFSVLEDVIINKNKKTDPDSLSLELIILSSRINNCDNSIRFFFNLAFIST